VICTTKSWPARPRVAVIHLWTDYVYAGTKAVPYREDDYRVAPINIYGASKAAGDSTARAENPTHLLLRVSWVFGIYGTNFVKTMLRLGRERRELRIVADQIRGPTEARDIARGGCRSVGRLPHPLLAEFGQAFGLPLGRLAAASRFGS
jgi:dTDP-4-dehydrorhamnose reductase